jgi:hypothetical protein
MGNYLTEILSFVVGGGLTTLLNFGLSRKKAKLDQAQAAVDFWEGLNAKLILRIENLENQVKWLSDFKCERHPCAQRIPPTELDIKQQ